MSAQRAANKFCWAHKRTHSPNTADQRNRKIASTKVTMKQIKYKTNYHHFLSLYLGRFLLVFFRSLVVFVAVVAFHSPVHMTVYIFLCDARARPSTEKRRKKRNKNLDLVHLDTLFVKWMDKSRYMPKETKELKINGHYFRKNAPNFTKA